MHPLRLALPLLAVLACAEEPPPHHDFEVGFLAADDRGRPLAGVTVALAGESVGVTADDGQLRRRLRAIDGHRVRVEAGCPDGHLEAELSGELVLRALRRLDEPDAITSLTLSITCPRAERRAAVVVRADGRAGLPVVVDGVPRAVTDASGVAHLALPVAPHRSLRIALDTSAAPRLRPQSPQRVFTLGEADEVFVFDQPFETRRKRRKRRPAPEQPEPEPEEPRRPVRLN